jgi:hypothetical protein
MFTVGAEVERNVILDVGSKWASERVDDDENDDVVNRHSSSAGPCSVVLGACVVDRVFRSTERYWCFEADVVDFFWFCGIDDGSARLTSSRGR